MFLGSQHKTSINFKNVAIFSTTHSPGQWFPSFEQPISFSQKFFRCNLRQYLSFRFITFIVPHENFINCRILQFPAPLTQPCIYITINSLNIVRTQIKIFLQYPRCTHEIFIFELRRAMQYQLRDLLFSFFQPFS